MMSATYQSVTFKAPEGSEVIGGMLLPYFDNLAGTELEPILRRHGLVRDEIRPDAWYSYQVLLDISRELSTTGISTGDIAIGKAFAPWLIQQFKVRDVEHFFEEVIHEAVRMGVRNVPDSYGYHVEKVGHQHYRITCNIPTPSGINYGSFWEACRLLKKDGEDFTLKIIEGLEKDHPGPAVLDIIVG